MKKNERDYAQYEPKMGERGFEEQTPNQPKHTIQWINNTNKNAKDLESDMKKSGWCWKDTIFLYHYRTSCEKTPMQI